MNTLLYKIKDKEEACKKTKTYTYWIKEKTNISFLNVC